MEIHIRIKCDLCNGSGRDPKNKLSCLRCGSSGYIEKWVDLGSLEDALELSTVIKKVLQE